MPLLFLKKSQSLFSALPFLLPFFSCFPSPHPCHCCHPPPSPPLIQSIPTSLKVLFSNLKDNFNEWQIWQILLTASPPLFPSHVAHFVGVGNSKTSAHLWHLLLLHLHQELGYAQAQSEFLTQIRLHTEAILKEKKLERRKLTQVGNNICIKMNSV